MKPTARDDGDRGPLLILEVLLIYPIPFLSTYTVLGAGDTMMNKTDINPCIKKLPSGRNSKQ